MVGVHEMLQHISDGQISKCWLSFWFKMTEYEDMHSSAARALNSQGAVENHPQEDSGAHPKKIPHVKRQKRNYNEMVGGTQAQ